MTDSHMPTDPADQDGQQCAWCGPETKWRSQRAGGERWCSTCGRPEAASVRARLRAGDSEPLSDEIPVNAEALTAARTAVVSFDTTTEQTVMVTRTLSADGRSATYSAVFDGKECSGERTFDEALAAVGLQAHRRHGRPSEIRPVGSIENDAATAAIEDAFRDWSEAAKSFATVDILDAAAYEHAAAAEERTWSAYCDIYEAVHGEQADVPAAGARSEVLLGRESRQQVGRAESRQFDALAERAAARQHLSSGPACGRTVQVTQMPCRLAPGHRGRCRSR